MAEMAEDSSMPKRKESVPEIFLSARKKENELFLALWGKDLKKNSISETFPSERISPVSETI